MYLNNTSLEESDLFTDRITYTDLKALRIQINKFSNLSERICQGDTDHMDTIVSEAGLSDNKTTHLLSQRTGES
jgi:hypothetical protein